MVTTVHSGGSCRCLPQWQVGLRCSLDLEDITRAPSTRRTAEIAGLRGILPASAGQNAHDVYPSVVNGPIYSDLESGAATAGCAAASPRACASAASTGSMTRAEGARWLRPSPRRREQHRVARSPYAWPQ